MAVPLAIFGSTFVIAFDFWTEGREHDTSLSKDRYDGSSF